MKKAQDLDFKKKQKPSFSQEKKQKKKENVDHLASALRENLKRRKSRTD